MNNKEFIASLSEKCGLQPKATQTLVSNMIGIMAEKLEEGKSVSFQQFGSFEVKKKLERVIVNPTTKQRMLVPPKLVVNFKPAQMLKDRMK